MCWSWRSDKARVLHTSTSEIYGIRSNIRNVRATGNVNTIGPRSCYDEGKRAAETLAADYPANMESMCVGTHLQHLWPQQHPQMGAYQQLHQQALHNRPLPSTRRQPDAQLPVCRRPAAAMRAMMELERETVDLFCQRH